MRSTRLVPFHSPSRFALNKLVTMFCNWGCKPCNVLNQYSKHEHTWEIMGRHFSSANSVFGLMGSSIVVNIYRKPQSAHDWLGQASWSTVNGVCSIHSCRLTYADIAFIESNLQHLKLYKSCMFMIPFGTQKYCMHIAVHETQQKDIVMSQSCATGLLRHMACSKDGCLRQFTIQALLPVP